MSSSLNYIWHGYLWSPIWLSLRCYLHSVHFRYTLCPNSVFDNFLLKQTGLKIQIFIMQSTKSYWMLTMYPISVWSWEYKSSKWCGHRTYRIITTVFSVYFPESKNPFSTILWPINSLPSLLSVVLEIGYMKGLFPRSDIYPQGFMDMWVKIILLSCIDSGECGRPKAWREDAFSSPGS